MIRADILAEAVRALGARRLRTALSALGIVAGTAAVVAACAIGEGARRAALAEIGALGVDNVFVRATPRQADPRAGTRPAPILELRDLEVIRRAFPDVRFVAGVRSSPVDVSAGPLHATASLVGVTDEWHAIANVRVARGRWLSALDYAGTRRSAVIGAALARNTFGTRDAIGADILAAGQWFHIVGVLEGAERRRTAPPGTAVQRFDVADTLIVPFAAMDQRLGSGDDGERVEEIAVRLNDGRVAEDTAKRLAGALGRLHPGAEGEWELVVPRALLQARVRAERTFTLVLWAIGGLALAIGGVGIMNIMLTSVAERTAEIGVRRALGARRRDILGQFAAEAVIVSAVGGGVGLPAGAMLAALVAVAAGWPVRISLDGVALSLAMAMATGAAFGVYPARLAAALDPAAAIRAE